jgi:hypothetical protein
MQATLNGTAAKVLAIEAAKLEGAIVAELKRGTGQLTVQQAAEIRAALRNLVRESSKAVARKMGRFTRPSMNIAAGRVMDTTLVLLYAAKHPRLRNAFEMMRHYQQTVPQRALVQSEFYRARWAKSWETRQWDSIVSNVTNQLEEGALRAEGWKEVTQRILRPVSRLTENAADAIMPSGRLRTSWNKYGVEGGINGHMHPEAFARGFARTEIGSVVSRESIAESQDIGLEWFANIGIPDDRQSIICAEASAEEPMTLAEWSKWQRDPSDPSNDGGPPKRHVLNCRCDLIGIPEAARGMDWTQSNPDANTYQKQYAGDFERKEEVLV